MYKQQALIIDEDHDTIVLDIQKYSKSLECDLGDKVLYIESGQTIDCKTSYVNPILKKILFQRDQSYRILGFNVWDHNTLLIATMLMNSDYVYPICLGMSFVTQHFSLDPFMVRKLKGDMRFRNLIWE